MKAEDIINQIALQRGFNCIGKGTIDLVQPNGMSVHKRDVWNLSITANPEEYFSAMDKKYKSKTGYYCKFPLSSLQQGLDLCRELSENFGTQPCEMSSKQLLNFQKTLFLVIHIHPEYKFTPKTNEYVSATQELVLNFV